MDLVMGIIEFANFFYTRLLLKTDIKYNPYFSYF
jgi:hypothetical protein